ncbi:helix-turn-helix domain-containing protein [Streptomyces sp. NBC_00988]|uniref:helix-turn-helix domain-containing protein n=1 Tax=Streptomyces sp. NBC_00988 TaxID=2903704 RepID=UPI003863859E|nr:helix-turn-helix domain-containing protein [Streptomyces sp. NBC_00988]
MRLADSLSNPSAPLLRLIKVLERRGAEVRVQGEPVVADPAVATEIKENRKLSPDEVAELVEAYRQGATLSALSRRDGLHRQTVDQHVTRAGVAKRSQVKMTPARMATAKKLYEQGWSARQIAVELDVCASTVSKKLKRAGVEMRDRSGRY